MKEFTTPGGQRLPLTALEYVVICTDCEEPLELTGEVVYSETEGRMRLAMEAEPCARCAEMAEERGE